VDKFGPSSNGGQIYTSTDSGVFWTAHESNRLWQAVASSADGAKLVAVVSSGQIYTSTDGGGTWTARESNRSWTAVASSSDGVTLAAVVGSGQIYFSTDSGVTWCPQESNRNWSAIALSGDGSRRTALVNGGQIYTSLAIPLTGLQGSMLDLQYTGNGSWQPLSLGAVNGNFTIAGFPIIASTTAAPANGGTLTPTSGFVRLSPASLVTLNATTAISAGAAAGQMLILEGTSDSNTVTINDNANTRLVSNRTLGANDTLTLMWDGSAWVELAFANN